MTVFGGQMPGQTSEMRDRAIGCFLGLAVGDAVGTTLEFQPRDSYLHLTDMVGGGPFGLKPGQWTDDTSMALCLADSLLANERVDAHDLMARFRRWWREGYNSVTGECFDIGSTTSSAITRFERTGDPIAGSTDPRAAGNGSVMRLAPIALAFHSNPELAEAAARAQSVTTHGAPEAIDGCALLCRILLAAVRGQGKDAALNQGASPEWTPRIREIARGCWKGRPRNQISSTGYVVDTLQAALWSVDKTDTFRDAVLLAANLGGDADTVAAVTGQIAGAVYGASGIPERWLNQLAWRSRLAEMAQQLLELRSPLAAAFD